MDARVAGLAGFPEAGDLIWILKMESISNKREEREIRQEERMLGKGQRSVDLGILGTDVEVSA